MSKKKGIALFLIFFIIGIGLCYAIETVIRNFYPQEGTVVSMSFKVYLDDQLQPNNTLIPWGDLVAGEEYYYENLTVKNTGTIDITVYLLVKGLPTGWTETWNGNATFLAPNNLAQGPLNLTVSASATDGTYNWNSWIQVVET